MQKFLKRMKKYQNTTTGEKSLKTPFIFIFDVEFLLKKLQSCRNNPEKSYTEKKRIITEKQIVLKRGVKNLKIMQWK